MVFNAKIVESVWQVAHALIWRSSCCKISVKSLLCGNHALISTLAGGGARWGVIGSSSLPRCVVARAGDPLTLSWIVISLSRIINLHNFILKRSHIERYLCFGFLICVMTLPWPKFHRNLSDVSLFTNLHFITIIHKFTVRSKCFLCVSVKVDCKI